MRQVAIVRAGGLDKGRPREPERPLLDHPSLHTESIELSHPSTGQPITFRVDPPKDFAVTLRQLCKYAS